MVQDETKINEIKGSIQEDIQKMNSVVEEHSIVKAIHEFSPRILTIKKNLNKTLHDDLTDILQRMANHYNVSFLLLSDVILVRQCEEDGTPTLKDCEDKDLNFLTDYLMNGYIKSTGTNVANNFTINPNV